MKIGIHPDVIVEVNMLKTDEPEQAARISKRIEELKYDPFPYQSKRVQNLKKERRTVYRFYTQEFHKHRIFYLVDKQHNCIYVIQMVEKRYDEDGRDLTYDPKSHHYMEIRARYDKYFEKKLWRTVK